jgi:arabinan endo-1,5-alpha-L-arabinosidase
MKRLLLVFLYICGGLLALWLVAELLVRVYMSSPLETGFYGSLTRAEAAARQAQIGIKVVDGPGWSHLAWIADPDQEDYRIVRLVNGEPQTVGSSYYGSFLLRQPSGSYQVWAVPYDTKSPRLIGEVEVHPTNGAFPIFAPRLAGGYQTLFQPTQSGFYINDHTVYQAADGQWRLVGITSRTEGDFNQERYFAVGSSPDFPPAGGMHEEPPLAEFGDLAWAPHVIRAGQTYHMFWSPHKLHHMTSPDGIEWQDHEVIMTTPVHRFFRDPMVLKVAEDQWLLYSTSQGSYFSQVDIYQSFNLLEWQYIGSALTSGWGSERNSPFASMESPYVSLFRGRYYLSLTYNNDSFFWPGILMLYHVWPDPSSYNDTLVFQSDNPYDFGEYRGRDNSPSLVAGLTAHAAELVYQPQQDAWYITTAGWPWVATLTHGEVAVAPLEWDPAP